MLCSAAEMAKTELGLCPPGPAHAKRAALWVALWILSLHTVCGSNAAEELGAGHMLPGEDMETLAGDCCHTADPKFVRHAMGTAGCTCHSECTPEPHPAEKGCLIAF